MDDGDDSRVGWGIRLMLVIVVNSDDPVDSVM